MTPVIVTNAISISPFRVHPRNLQKNGHIWVAVSPPFGKRPIILSLLVFREGTHSENVPFCWMGKTEWVCTLQLAICPVILKGQNAPSNNMSLEGLRVPLVPLDSPHYESKSNVQGPTNISSNIALDHTPNFPKPLARNKFVHKDSRYSISATFFVGTFGTLGRYIYLTHVCCLRYPLNQRSI